MCGAFIIMIFNFRKQFNIQGKSVLLFTDIAVNEKTDFHAPSISLINQTYWKYCRVFFPWKYLQESAV